MIMIYGRRPYTSYFELLVVITKEKRQNDSLQSHGGKTIYRNAPKYGEKKVEIWDLTSVEYQQDPLIALCRDVSFYFLGALVWIL